MFDTVCDSSDSPTVCGSQATHEKTSCHNSCTHGGARRFTIAVSEHIGRTHNFLVFASQCVQALRKTHDISNSQ